MAYGPNLTKFITTKMREKGINEFQAAQLPGAKQAFEADQQLAYKLQCNRTKEEVLADFLRICAEEGRQPVFESVEEFNELIADPMYRESKGYREAMQAIAANSPAVMSGPNLGEKGTLDALLAGPPVDLLAEAKRDAVMERFNNHSPRTAEGRLARMEMMTNPETAHYFDGFISSAQEQINHQAAIGGAEQITLDSGSGNSYQAGRHPRDIDYERGTYVDGSPLPIGNVNGEDGLPL